MVLRYISAACIVASFAQTAWTKRLACNADIPHPQYFGAEVTSLVADEVHNFTEWMDMTNLNSPNKAINFCNVTITYTHPGQGDSVNIFLYLPLENWNGNFLGQGGGGYAAGMEMGLPPATGLGYATATTDAGHNSKGDFLDIAAGAERWALTSPGNINWALLQNFASRSLDDLPHLAKGIIESFYGIKPKYSYWNGCSTGGRQGLMSAQRYPGNYDGILSACPAINWHNFLVAESWGQVKMRKEKYFPPPCEMEAVRKAALEACDELDGVIDGVVAAPGLCKFDAESVVGQKFNCDGKSRKISKSAARILNSAWRGVEKDGKFEWYGLTYGTPFATFDGLLGALLQTSCDNDNNNCKGSPFPISSNWIRLFLKQDPDYDIDSMTEDEFFGFLHQSRQQFSSIMGSDDPDLREARAVGGKIISWHGLADELIYPNGTSNYYERVEAIDPKVRDFYRHFEVPGVGHCGGGIGAFPHTAFQALVNWVEKGQAPESIDAFTSPTDETETVRYRPLCPYPSVAAYIGGNPDVASSFECAKSFGTKRASDETRHTEL